MVHHLFTLFLAVVLALHTCCAAERAEVVIVIVADDLGEAGFSSGGSSPIPTKALDALARRSVDLPLFTAHSTCTPSRSALLTGRYSHVNGLVGPADGQFGLDSLPSQHETLAERKYMPSGEVTWARTPTHLSLSLVGDAQV